MASIGEDRVRITFNPSSVGEVDQIKQKAADLINFIDALPAPAGETIRLKALAMTAIEEGAMWAVKAATA
jgi:hypothetical protein